MITANEVRKLMPDYNVLNNHPELESLIKDAAKGGYNQIKYCFTNTSTYFDKMQEALHQLGYTIHLEKWWWSDIICDLYYYDIVIKW